ncbi:MAG: hypothetical protein GY810_10450 [Aureispira sp.]|nr:hypothetical protein [Aureispira sp.]
MESYTTSYFQLELNEEALISLQELEERIKFVKMPIQEWLERELLFTYGYFYEDRASIEQLMEDVHKKIGKKAAQKEEKGWYKKDIPTNKQAAAKALIKPIFETIRDNELPQSIKLNTLKEQLETLTILGLSIWGYYEKDEVPELIDILDRVIKLLEMREELLQETNQQNQFTGVNQEALNLHLNEMASQGWLLQNIQPLNKGVHQSFGGTTEDQKVRGGLGFSLTEGFIFFWKKIKN